MDGRRPLVAMALGLLVAALNTAQAQTDPTITAQRASALLAQASTGLAEAESARDRVAALTETIRAFEEGLAAVREALRRSEAREAALLARLEAQQDHLSALLAAMQALDRAPPPLLMMHPGGPEAAVRSGLIVSDIAPSLAAETVALRADLAELQAMRDIQDTANRDLRTALEDAQTARAALSEAIADRVDLPPRVVTDAQAMAALLAAATSLDALAAELHAAPLGPLPETLRIDTARGTLDLPVFGTVLRGFGAADAAGVARPGLILATRENALVTAPWSGTIRYAGALPGEGTAVLLEPDGDHLIILTGLSTLFVATGEIVARGTPLGLMADAGPTSEELITAETEDAGLTLSETLYIEIRVDNEPVDPSAWFRVTRDED